MLRHVTALVGVVTLLFLVASAPARAHSQQHRSFIVSGLMCIHSYEGSWRDPGSPYWGGLQMDLNFQSAYGWIRHGRQKWSFLRHWGTADNWPVWAQIVSGIHGYFHRGWSPWPNTARYCGLA